MGCATVKQVKKLRSATGKYIYEEFIPGLQAEFITAGFTDVVVKLYEEEGENLEPVQISVIYKSSSTMSAYTVPQVKIEIGSRSLKEPFTNRNFSSLVGEYFLGKEIADGPIQVQCVNPERTFLEKLFLLHEEFQKPKAEIRVNRLSRHLYDIEMLMRHGVADVALKEMGLYNEIIKHRSVYTKISGIDYSLHQPQTLNPVPPDAIISEWENDYKKMQLEMIYGNSLSFNELMHRIKELKEKINSLSW